MEKEKVVNMGHLEALAVLQQRKLNVSTASAAKIAAPDAKGIR